MEQVWDSLVSVIKWRKEQRNLRPGDIVLIKTIPTVGKPSTKLARVKEVFPDQYGTVRDVMVASYHKQRKEKAGPYVPVQLELQKLPVQRLVVMIPAEDVPHLEPASPDLHICDEEMRVPTNLHSLPNGPTAPPTSVPRSPHPATTTRTPQSPSLTEVTATVKHVNALVMAARQDDTERDCWQCEVRHTVRATTMENDILSQQAGS